MTTTQGPAPLSIVISEEAARHVKEFAAAEGNSEADIRVGVKGGGCSGLTYILEMYLYFHKWVQQILHSH